MAGPTCVELSTPTPCQLKTAKFKRLHQTRLTGWPARTTLFLLFRQLESNMAAPILYLWWESDRSIRIANKWRWTCCCRWSKARHNATKHSSFFRTRHHFFWSICIYFILVKQPDGWKAVTIVSKYQRIILSGLDSVLKVQTKRQFLPIGYSLKPLNPVCL